MRFAPSVAQLVACVQMLHAVLAQFGVVALVGKTVDEDVLVGLCVGVEEAVVAYKLAIFWRERYCFHYSVLVHNRAIHYEYALRVWQHRIEVLLLASVHRVGRSSVFHILACYGLRLPLLCANHCRRQQERKKYVFS